MLRKYHELTCRIHSLIFVLALSLCTACAWGQKSRTAEFYNSLLNLTSEQLMSQGDDFRRKDETIDSALVCYTILGNRSDASKNSAEQALCIKAFTELAYLYYFHYYDYSKAFEHMTKAQEIADRWGIKPVEVPLYLGLMYGSLGEQSGDRRASLKSLDLLREAFNTAYRNRDSHNLNMAYSNLVSHAFMLGEIDTVQEENRMYLDFAKNNKDDRYYVMFNDHLFHALNAMLKEQYGEAMSHFDLLTEEIPDELKYARYITGAWQFKAFVHERQGNYAAALGCLEEALKLVERYDLKDAKVELMRQMVEDAGKLGRNEDKYRYQNQYLAIKDSVLNYQQVASIDEVRFLGEIRKAEDNIKAAEERRKHLEKYLIWGGVVLLLLLALVYFIVTRNRQLRRRNEALYKKNLEVLQAEEHERELRGRFQQELDDLKARYEAAAQGAPGVENLESPESPESADDRDDMEFPDQAQGGKYRSSSLREGDKGALADRIREVMETNGEIYQPDFTAERLAELVNEKYKRVSQAINEVFGCNFNTLLNNYRIREACKRISDEDNYGHLTLEALSQSVGMKSRSTFVLQFKRVTGLTPSQYLAAARKN